MRRRLSPVLEPLLALAALLVLLAAHRFLDDFVHHSADAPDRLRTAVASADLPAVRQLLDRGLHPDTPGDGIPPLQFATDPNIARLLLQHGACPTGPQHDNAPLIAAIATGNLEVARLLLDAGADPNLRAAPKGFTPLDTALAYHRTTMAALLRAYGARTAN